MLFMYEMFKFLHFISLSYTLIEEETNKQSRLGVTLFMDSTVPL